LKPQRKITLPHDIPPNRSIAAPGNKTSIPNRSVAGRKFRRLNVTIASAWPFTATSSTMSSSASCNEGRHLGRHLSLGGPRPQASAQG
jgi:hypothetical protein